MDKDTLKKRLEFGVVFMNIAMMIPAIYIILKFDIPRILVWLCFIPLNFLFMLIISKILNSKKYKKLADELEKDCQEEEEAERRKGERPNMSSITMIAVVCMAITIGNSIEVIYNACAANDSTTKNILPACINILTSFTCCGCLGFLLYNIRKRRVFVSINSNLMYFIGATLILSTILQTQLWETTEMIPNLTVAMYYYLFGVLVMFFGKLFNIAIKIKEEQDLTI